MLILCGNTVVAPDWEVNEKEAVGFSRIYYVRSGHAVYTGNGHTCHLVPGRVYILPNSIPYQIRRDQEQDFSCTYMHLEIPKLWVNDIIELVLKEEDSLCHYWMLIYSLIEEGQKDFLGKLVEHFSHYFKNHENCVNYSEFLHKTTTYIQEHLSEKITVEELSALSHYNPNYFIEVFRKEAQCTPYQYIVRAKMQNALRLFELDKDIKYITEALGYADIGSFCRVFKRFYGKAPKEYWKNLKANS